MWGKVREDGGVGCAFGPPDAVPLLRHVGEGEGELDRAQPRPARGVTRVVQGEEQVLGQRLRPVVEDIAQVED